MRAALAGRAVAGRRCRDEGLAGAASCIFVQDAEIGRDDETRRVELHGRVDQLRGRADDVGLRDDALRRFRMHEHLRVGIFRAQQVELDALEFVVNEAGSLPHQHVGAGFLLNIATEMAIRRPDDLLAARVEIGDDLGDRSTT